MVVRLQDADGVNVYNLTAGKALPAWVTKKRGRGLSRDAEYAKHVELIQGFAFPSACHRIKITRDMQYVFATGVHAPRVRVYELSNLALKFEHHFDSEIVDFQILTEDYSKVVYLCMDRTVNFHTRMGRHFTTRVPKAGRDIAYDPRSAEVLIAGSAPEIWRINCQEGRFMESLPTALPAVNALGVCPAHGMLAAAGEEGLLECFDPRERSSLGVLSAAQAAGHAGEDLTAVRFDRTGMYAGVGTSGGKVAIFDLRRPVPLVVKDHMYDSPITDIKFHSAVGDHTGAQRVVSADQHIVKVWDMHTGAGYTNIEPEGEHINDVATWPGSGLMFVGADAKQVGVYFVPSLGPAPAWASFLEAVVDDMEASSRGPATVYDDYRFVTKAELSRLELDHLLGTPMVRAYMHGFFIDNRLYHKARNRVDPFAYETYRQKRIEQKLEAERQSRISMVKKLPKINADAHIRLQAATMAAEATDKKAAKADGETAKAVLEDDRFAAMFEDADFAIDEGSRAYKELHPNAVHRKKTLEEQLIEEHFQRAAADSDAEASGSGADTDGAEGSDDDVAARPRKRLLVARDEASADLLNAGTSQATLREVPLADRARASEATGRHRVGGNRELSFRARTGPRDDFRLGRSSDGRGGRQSGRGSSGRRGEGRGDHTGSGLGRGAGRGSGRGGGGGSRGGRGGRRGGRGRGRGRGGR